MIPKYLLGCFINCMLRMLSERQGRYMLAFLSFCLPYGYITYICEITGVHRNTITNGRKEIFRLHPSLPAAEECGESSINEDNIYGNCPKENSNAAEKHCKVGRPSTSFDKFGVTIFHGLMAP